ncbi:hypothetical protein BRADI_3g49941v3 [Brachypodium distachyon]|uniref:Reverse transcriptase zinc-binding domain-containing protein n=1 Tax=Brachypodium distachyon TaxID=15368 RepID=A0A0Q3IIW3_BRADI|nr:hypothetical protein BRADI_3g49941v3 [Brachypodium distachyon]
MDLFRALTRILLGAGEKALFWHDAWLPDGSTLKLRWPGLFAITSRKNRTVQKELANRNWVRALLRIGTTQQLADFVSLWNSISWTWMPSDSYSAASAYRIQFHGSTPPFASQKI